MGKIVLTEEQVAILKGATGPVIVCDPEGNIVASVDPTPTPDEISELKRRAAGPGPWYTTGQVLARLEALQAEQSRAGSPLDAERVRDLLNGWRDQEPGCSK